MKLLTIGFAGKSAERFFELLKDSKATKLIDIRINRTSQLAGFTKEQDLKYFLPKLAGMDHLIREDLAPTKELLAAYRNKEVDWLEFSQKYHDLLQDRGAIESFTPEIFDNSVLLCSESKTEFCHRTLLANELVAVYPDLTVINLI
jgi:uncharacterized protein YeaO (DUF488 family)